MSNSGFHEKMDAFDLIITALKDHEKRLDAISNRLKSMINEVKTEIDKIGVVKKEERRIEPPAVKKAPLVICNKWNEFKDRCKGAKIVTFEVEKNFFHVYSMVSGDVFRYSEGLPNKRLKVVEEQSCFSIDKASLNNIDLLQFLIEGRLKCGLSLSIKSSRTVLSEKQFLFELSYDFNPDEVKEFFSGELSVSKGDVVEGKITY